MQTSNTRSLTSVPLLVLFTMILMTLASQATGADLWVHFIGEPHSAFVSGERVGYWGAFSAGDLNGDGFDDVLVSAPREADDAEYYMPRWRVYLGGPEHSESADVVLAAWGDWGVAHAPGDMNGDTYADVIIQSDYSGNYSQAEIYVGGPSLDLEPDAVISPLDEGHWFARDVVLGNLYGSSAPELVVASPYENIPGAAAEVGAFHVYELELATWGSGTYWEPQIHFLGSPERGQMGGGLISLGDITADGYIDLLVHLGVDGWSVVYGGPGFAFESDAPAEGYLLGVPVGDLNDDGRTDFYHEDAIYFGGIPTDGPPAVTAPALVCAPEALGDFDGDGYNDMIAAESDGDGAWVKILLGGPDMDATADWGYYQPGTHGQAGSEGTQWAASSAGDVDGDGRDDIVVVDPYLATPLPDVAGASNGQAWMYVNIMDGPPTVIGDSEDDTPPETVRYRMGLDVHPNPFNPHTTVEYVAPDRGHVSLKIYTLRGELVSVLLDDIVGEGPGRVLWDGRDQTGNPVSTGAYFAEMRGFGKSLSTKLVLLK